MLEIVATVGTGCDFQLDTVSA